MPTETEQPNEELPTDAPISDVRAAYNRERERRREIEQSASDADTLRRENAFLRAGVDSESEIGRYFTRGYDGELDVDAIKAAWSKVAPSTPTTPPPPSGETQPPAGEQPPGQPGLSEEEMERLRVSRQGLQSESAPPGSEPTTPLGTAIMDAAFEAQGGTRARPNQGMSDKALNAGFSEVFRRGNEGDPEAVFKRPDENWADATDRWRANQG